ncbi:hypothetical protein ACG33_00020 [Steroidobacter denitrificans]|uniref:AAA+ ATPase domain-containing protein n=1 Tax=Steroidobacter denitrificans TaxID=465721 RepID=A0A127F7A6_STEDE|nr:AAA family ATPase [Steroidobacter denitrificans]AMN45511.1 hypothetical protein ACG33_00020 [Steroidobacter denitrificans]
MAYFSRIALVDWRQFASIEIDLSKQVTILTGPNGSGKTTILNILSKHFGWNLSFVSTPYLGLKQARKLWSDVKRAREEELLDAAAASEAQSVGYITYDDGRKCILATTKTTKPQYRLAYANEQSVVGLHIPSHRPPATYQAVGEIPTNPTSIQQHYQDFQQLLFQTYGGARQSNKQQNPSYAQKRSLIALALFGYGNKAVASNVEYQQIFESFQEVLRLILPKEIGFERLEVRMPEVVLVTRSGEFAIDSMSGGINAMFGIAWQIHMYGAGKSECTVTIDEPENHLHPSMQRSFLPSLAAAFPRFKFIVATHSPFVVSSHRSSSVYGLTFSENHQVISSQLTEDEFAGTPNRILREILDVPSNLPIWVEDEIRKIFENASGDNPHALGERVLAELRRLGVVDAASDLNLEDGQ